MKENKTTTNEMKVKEYLQKYERIMNNIKYEMYFISEHKLYKIQLDKLSFEMVKLGKESSSKGGYEKLRLSITKAIKQEFINSGKARYIMTEEHFIEKAKVANLNKGQYCEYISATSRKQEYKLDSVRFDKGGDVNLKRKQIQVKFENASLTQLRTIDKAYNEKFANV